MKLSKLKLDTAEVIPLYDKNSSARVVSDGEYFYKLWSPDHIDPHTIMDGLDFVWGGYDKLMALEVGLINEETCPAFCEPIYDGDRCCGYITKAGSNNISAFDMTAFYKVLADTAAAADYTYIDVHAKNLVVVDDQISIIDCDFAPGKISTLDRLTESEQELWWRIVLNESYLSEYQKDTISYSYSKILKRALSK
jgi:hypothetical protein